MVGTQGRRDRALATASEDVQLFLRRPLCAQCRTSLQLSCRPRLSTSLGCWLVPRPLREGKPSSRLTHFTSSYTSSFLRWCATAALSRCAVPKFLYGRPQGRGCSAQVLESREPCELPYLSASDNRISASGVTTCTWCGLFAPLSLPLCLLCCCSSSLAELCHRPTHTLTRGRSSHTVIVLLERRFLVFMSFPRKFFIPIRIVA